MIAYVDDTTNGCSDLHLDDLMPYLDLVHYIQDTVQKWEQILWSSGGAHNLQKSFWYLIYWEWHKGHPEMATSVSTHTTIALTTGKVCIKWSNAKKCGRP